MSKNRNKINSEFIPKPWGAMVSFNGVNMMFIYPETAANDNVEIEENTEMKKAA